MSDDHRSIGEVLELLQAEFPDVTVSKIRFLESQGLIAPERTPSGYRKFYDGDVDRLRWILRQQKDHYLPLKVIKSRLVQLEEEGAVENAEAAETVEGVIPEPAPAEVAGRSEAGEAGATPANGAASHAEGAAGAGGGPDGGATGEASGEVDGEANGEVRAESSGAALTRGELARATGVDEKMLRELEGYGLLPPPRRVDDQDIYDEHALVVARLARGFMRHGVEARHLRMYKTFAEREAAFVGQLVMPLLKQRNPDARQQARELVSELAKLGSGMRAAMLRTALRGAFEE